MGHHSVLHGIVISENAYVNAVLPLSSAKTATMIATTTTFFEIAKQTIS